MIIDREVVSVQNMLVALASSPHLQAKNLEAFHHQASQVAREIGTQIVLRDPQRDEQLVNTAVPWGEKLPVACLVLATKPKRRRDNRANLSYRTFFLAHSPTDMWPR